MKKIKIAPVNYMTVSDVPMRILITKGKKKRYRTIIRAYYKRMGIK